jgi:parvulin-like peptidyl-prolyl isomerase
MTSRARPPRARTWDDRERRNMLLNIGFGLTIIAALLLLLIAFGVSWYGEHLSPAGSVNGTTITKDALTKAQGVNSFRIEYAQRRIRTLLAAGHISAATAEARQSTLDTNLSNIQSLSLEQLIDGNIQADLAAKQGIAITPADVDAKVKEEATTPELRHAWVIEVKPEVASGATTPTDAAVAAARAKADQALADLKAGKDWDTIAKAVSTGSTKDQAGDLGFIDKDNSLDAAFSIAMLAAAKDTPTAVVEGADTIFRIGRVSEIVAPVEDATLTQQVQDAGISLEDFRASLQRDVTRTKLSEAILAQFTAPGPQRQVAEIFLESGQSESGPKAIKVRHILYSPNDDPSNASKVDAADPAWAAAETAAKATWEKLKTDPSQFDSIARAESDEGSAATTGGKLPWFSTDDGIAQAFADAVFKDGLQPGQLLDPVKSEFGWHVIQVMYFPTDAQRAAQLKADIDAGKLTFADAARDNSYAADAAKGGDLGWIGKGQLEEAKEQAIFAAPIGKVSDPYTASDGIYLFYVSKEETREPDAEQKANLEKNAFSIWYSKQKAGYTITRDATATGTSS